MDTSLTDVLRASEKAMYEVKLMEGKKAGTPSSRPSSAHDSKGYETKERVERAPMPRGGICADPWPYGGRRATF
jgi:hypothetical protein